MPPSSDDQLISGIQAGDEAIEIEFDRRFRHKIEAFARKQRVAGHDCADVAQEVLVDAVRQIRKGRFRQAAALATWLRTLMNGKVADYFRARKQSQLVSLEDIAEDHGALIARGNTEALVAVNEALSRLSAEDSLLLILHEQQRFTLAEICPMLGLRKSAVAERLNRARERFRVALREGGKNPTVKRLKDH